MCDCGKNPVAYIRDNWIVGKKDIRICCVCADRMMTYVPGIKEALNIREINTVTGELLNKISATLR